MLKFAFLTMSLALVCTCTLAQDGPPMPPSPDGAPRPGDNNHARMALPVRIGPTDSTTPKFMHGMTNIIASPPRDINPATIEISMDDKPIGIVNKKPYFLKYDISAVPEGDYTLTAVGYDSGHNKVWSASSKVTVRIPKQTPGGAPPKPVGNPTIAPTPAFDSGIISNVYRSAKYDFAVSYPAGYAVKDATAQIKPKQSGAIWVVISEGPANKSQVVINLRRSKLKAGTTAETFAKFNKYVQEWEKTTILGSPAFKTTAGTPSAKRVVHRLIVIKNGNVWMLNCIDTSGKPAEEAQQIFDNMVNSLKTSLK